MKKATKTMLLVLLVIVGSKSVYATEMDNIAAIVNGDKIYEREVKKSWTDLLSKIPTEQQELMMQILNYDDYRQMYVMNFLIEQEISSRKLDNICTVSPSEEMTNDDERLECLSTNIIQQALSSPELLLKTYNELKDFTGEKTRYNLEYAVFPSEHFAKKAFDVAKTKMINNINGYNAFEGRQMSGGKELERTDNKFIIMEEPEFIRIVGIDSKEITEALQKSIYNTNLADINGPIPAGEHFIIYCINEINGKDILTYDSFVENIIKKEKNNINKVLMRQMWYTKVNKYFGKEGKVIRRLLM